jgi:hypothetical protein
MTGKGGTGQAASPGGRELPSEVRRRARRLAWIYLLAAGWLILWTAYLALSLPRENLEHHYRLTWVGFDVILALSLYLTAHMAFRLDARVQAPATVAATLLVVDAWFDITTSTDGKAAIEALILALFVELPAAAFTLYVAHKVGRRVRELAHVEHVHTRHPPAVSRQQADPAPPTGRPAAAEPDREQ